MSQNPFSQKVKIYTYSSVCLTAVAILLRIGSFIFAFDPDVGYFDASPLHTIYRTLCVLIVFWNLTAILFIPRHSFPESTKPHSTNLTRLSALFCAVLVAGSCLFFYENMFYYSNHALLYSLLALFALPSSIYFVLSFLSKHPAEYTALSAYITLLWCGIMLSATYLNLYVTMNSPFKVTLHMAILALMLHLIEEARMLTEHGFRIHYLAYTLIAILNCGLSSIPVLIAYVTGIYQNLDYLFYAVLTLGFFLCLCARAHACYRTLIVTPLPTPEEIEAAEKKRKMAKEKKKNKKNPKKQPSDPQHTTDTVNQNDETEGDDAHVS